MVLGTVPPGTAAGQSTERGSGFGHWVWRWNFDVQRRAPWIGAPSVGNRGTKALLGSHWEVGGHQSPSGGAFFPLQMKMYPRITSVRTGVGSARARQLGQLWVANGATKIRRTFPPPEGFSCGGGSYFTACSSRSGSEVFGAACSPSGRLFHGLQQAGSSGKV